ncbi:hypothetical protein PATSB16_00940 [Pandoraea thiooxydans]|uniref:DUF4148 domain-containing protein n=1 Tax=Pandoraea thiooxydans TaxID=445709 RepID=A0A0G3ESU8_9BURK|nr:DUF4148 domain-containing protein [Pandoraea thiooxydans]AKJ70025.1 hypothetical protein ABW99_19250 [Pandoraea thiooxydans]APR93438.1 hypothetical protein PATSB16_00940 [Pandoraea thiooxydans]
MKTPLIVAALLSAFVAAPVFARGSADLGTDTSWIGVSTLSRAAVRADLINAESQGLVQQTNTVYPKAAPAAQALASAPVRAGLEVANVNSNLYSNQ